MAVMYILGFETLIGFLITAAISVAVSYLAYLLTPKPKQDNPFKDQPPSLSARGSWIGRLQGKRRIGCVIAWVGDRLNRKADSGGKGSGSKPTSAKFYEGAWHQLCIGPAYALYQIRENEKVIFDTKITRDDTPSGSLLQCKEGSHFEIYWGEDDQPVCAYLAQFLTFKDHNGVDQPLASRWPGLCYIVWHRKVMVGSPTWPQLDYVLECRPGESGRLPHLAGVDIQIAETSPKYHDHGFNPMVCLWELLCAPYPWGLGMKQEYFAEVSFTYAGNVLSDEHMPLNIYIDAGNLAQDVVGELMKLCDMMISQVRGVLRPFLIRALPDGTVVPTLVEDLDIDPDPEEDKQHGTYSTDRLVFNFQDAKIGFRTYTIAQDRDWQAQYNQRTQTTEDTLPHVTDRVTASMIANRKRLQYSMNGHAVKLSATRDARNPEFHPGVVFNVPNLGQLRLMSKEMSTDKSRVELEAMMDWYSLGTNVDLPDNSAGESVIVDAADVPADLLFLPVYVPPALYPAGGAIAVVRVRGGTGVVGASVAVSDTAGGAYYNVGKQDAYACGGPLTGAMDGTTGANHAELASFGTFTSLNGDTQDAMDLTGSPAYANGAQLALVDHEIMYVRRIVSAGGSNWTLQGVRRGMYSTEVVPHAAGTPIIVFAKEDITPLPTTLAAGGNTIYVKTVPYDTGRQVDIATVTPRALFVDPIDVFHTDTSFDIIFDYDADRQPEAVGATVSTLLDQGPDGNNAAAYGAGAVAQIILGPNGKRAIKLPLDRAFHLSLIDKPARVFAVWRNRSTSFQRYSALVGNGTGGDGGRHTVFDNGNTYFHVNPYPLEVRKNGHRISTPPYNIAPLDEWMVLDVTPAVANSTLSVGDIDGGGYGGGDMDIARIVCLGTPPTATQIRDGVLFLKAKYLAAPAAGPLPWDPSTSANLMGWWETDSGVQKAGGGTAAPGDAVTKWVNRKTPGTYDMVPGGSGGGTLVASLFGSQPGIRINGASSAHKLTCSINPGSCTVLIVARMLAGGSRVICGVSNNWLLGWYAGTEDAAFFESGGVFGPQGAASVTASRCYTGTMAGNSKLYSKTALLATDGSGIAGPNGLELGANHFGQNSNCEVAAVLVWSEPLSASEVAQAAGYYASKYAVP